MNRGQGTTEEEVEMEERTVNETAKVIEGEEDGEDTPPHLNGIQGDNASVVTKNFSTFSDATSSDGGMGDTSSSALDQELLDQQPLNVCERVPLWLKLIIIASVSLFGVLVVGTWLLVIVGINLNLAARNNHLAYMVEETETVIKFIEVEMNRSFRYDVLGTDGTRLVAAWSETDVGLSHFSDIVMNTAKNHGTRLTALAVEDAQSYIDRLPSIRDRVTNQNIAIQKMTQFYTRFYISLMEVSTQMFTSQDIKQTIVQHNILNRIRSRDFALVTILSAVKLSHHNFTEDLFERFVAYRHQRDTNVNLFKAFGNSYLINKYENEVEASPEYAHLSHIEDYVFQNRYADTFDVDGEQYNLNATRRLSNIAAVLNEASGMLFQESQRLITEGVLEIIFVIAVAVIFFICAILISLVMARTIVGPWKRMLKLQEITIQRFVPSQFLVLMKCKKIRELTRGKAVQRDITVLCISIANFSEVLRSCQVKRQTNASPSESLGNTKIITFLNQYLEYMSEVIRFHNGYIDYFERDEIIACLKSPSSAINCALKYQKAVDTFNKIHHTQYPAIHVTIGIHHVEKIMIAAVGETERIHSTFLGEDFDIAKKLKTIAYRHDAKIMTTIKTLSHVHKNTKKLVKNRLVCKLFTSSGDLMDCVELFNPESGTDSLKISSAKLFSTGMDLLYKGQYLDALVRLQSASKVCNDQDPVTKYFIGICQQLLTETRNNMKMVTLGQTLKEAALLETFASFCKLEHSEENIELWNLIEKFKTIADVDERKNVVSHIMNEYLDPNANHCVNLSNEVKERSTKHLKEIITEGMCSTCDSPCTIMSNALFDRIKDAIELVMSDTFRRFQKSDTFRNAFMSSSLIVQPNHLYHHMKENRVV